jgi:type IV pilus assembly protein PilQ
MFAQDRVVKCLLAVVFSASLATSAVAQPDSSRATNLSSRGDTLQQPVGAADTTTLSFKDTDLRDIFRALSAQHGVNVFLDNGINKRVTVSLNRVRVYDAIAFLASENGLDLKLEGGIFKVVSPPPPELPPPPAPKIPKVAYEKNQLSVDLKNDDLESVISQFQAKCQKNILVISGTTGTVSGKLMDIDFDLGFTQLMNNNGFAVQKKNGIYIVSRLEYFVGTDGRSSGQKSGPYWVSVKDSMVSIDVTNASLERVLHDMTRQLNTDIVFYNAVNGTITARATSVPLSRALDLILRNTNFGYKETEGIFFVGEKANKALTTTRLLKLKYLTAEHAAEMIPQSITAQAGIKAMKEQNGLVVVGPADAVEQVKECLAQIDVPIAQVLIEAIVIDYDVSRGSEYGIDAGVFGGTDTSGYQRKGSLLSSINMSMKGDFLNRKLQQIGTVNLFGKEINIGKLGQLPTDFYLNVKAMERKGLANVKSHPVLATLNGHKASLSIGTTQYFLLKTTTPYRDQTQVLMQESQSFQTIEADVKLEITPYVGADGLITLEIKPDFRTPVGQFSSEVPPTINKREMSSTLAVKDGETVVLGGLVQESDSEDRTQVPLLGSIPFLGDLFSSSTKEKRKSQLMIYVTPRISYGEPFQSAYAQPQAE